MFGFIIILYGLRCCPCSNLSYSAYPNLYLVLNLYKKEFFVRNETNIILKNKFKETCRET